MKRLLQGYARFRREVFPEKKDHFHLLSELQTPDVLFITCADSRVVPDLILQTEPGDLFVCRTAGNVVPPHGYMPGGVSATVEYAVEVLQVKHIIICGHSDCGAVKAMFDRRDLSRLPLTARWLGLVEPAWKYVNPDGATDARSQYVALIHANVQAQMANLKTHPEIGRALAEGRLEVHGWYYDILTGAIEAYDERLRTFGPLDETVAGG
ncbi:MAG: carbonic anhydrase [Acidobacteriaceae bacterium]